MLRFRVADARQRVAQLWRGAVNIKDNALRVLLIINYILDWARDIYREAVIRSLRKLAVSDARSLAYKDSDIFSTTSRVRTWAVERGREAESGSGTGLELEIGPKDALRSFDTKNGVTRDIRHIRSRFLALYLTGDNLDLFLNSADTQQESKALACSLLSHLLEGWRITGETLNALEFDWTGKDRGADPSHRDKTFLVVATVAAYLTPDWEQTRELSCIALEGEAFSRLLERACRTLKGETLSVFPFVDKEHFSDSILILRRQSARDNLMACISRVCWATGILSPDDAAYKIAFSVISVEKDPEGVVRYRADTVLHCMPTAAKTRDFVSAVYNQYKVGRNDPFCPFLQASAITDELGLPGESTLAKGGSGVSRWFSTPPDIPGIGFDRGVIFAVSANPVIRPSTPKICLFVTDPASLRVNGSKFQLLLQSEPDSHFRVRRYDSKRGWSSG